MASVLAAVVSALWMLQPATDPGTDLRAARPEPGARLEQSPGTVELDLGRPWTGAAAVVEVTGPGDADLARGVPVVTADGLSQPIAPVDEAGAYQVAYQVPTTDGQVLTGSYWFTYTAPAVAAGRKVTALVALGLLGLMAGAAAVYAGRQRRATRASAVLLARSLAETSHSPTEPRVPRQRDRTDGDRVPPMTGTPRAGRPAGRPAGRSEEVRPPR